MLFLAQEIPRKGFDCGAIRFVEALVDADVLAIAGVLFWCIYWFENPGHPQHIGAVDAECLGNVLEALEARLCASSVLDITYVGSAKSSPVGELALADSLCRSSRFDPLAERASRLAVRLPATATTFEFGQGCRVHAAALPSPSRPTNPQRQSPSDWTVRITVSSI